MTYRVWMAHEHRQIISIAAAITVLVGALALFSLAMTGAASATEPTTVIGNSPPGDLDCDGLYEDIDGDGDSDVVDVQAMFANRHAIDSRDDATMFDYSGSSGVNVVDVQALFASLGDGSDTRLDLCEIERKVHELINDERTSRGLNSLDYDTRLSQIARYHSDNMAEDDDLYHTSPSGENRSDRYEKFGYQCRAYIEPGKYGLGAENVYWETLEPSDTESSIARAAVEGWMDSADHRKNILTDYWDDEGIGVGTTDGEVYITQNFC